MSGICWTDAVEPECFRLQWHENSLDWFSQPTWKDPSPLRRALTPWCCASCRETRNPHLQCSSANQPGYSTYAGWVYWGWMQSLLSLRTWCRILVSTAHQTWGTSCAMCGCARKSRQGEGSPGTSQRPADWHKILFESAWSRPPPFLSQSTCFIVYLFFLFVFCIPSCGFGYATRIVCVVILLRIGTVEEILRFWVYFC